MSVPKVLLRLPWHILLLTGVLVLVGSLALYSASQGSWQPWAGRHAVRAVVGLSLVIGIAFVDFDYIKRLSYVFLALALLINCRNDSRHWAKCRAGSLLWN